MRRLVVPLAAIAALVLAGCGGASGGGDAPEVTGEFGEQPTLAFPESEPPAELRVEVLSEGEGEEVIDGDYLVADYIGQVWGADSAFNDSFEAGYPAGFSLDQVIDGWQQGLPGTHVGDRVMLTIPPELGYPEGNENAGIEADDTLVFVIDVLDSFGADELAGQPDAADTGALADLPVTVTGAQGEQSEIAVKPDAAAPTEVSTTVIAEGTGEPVGEGGSVVVSFSAVGWDGTDGGSTWDYGAPETIALGAGTVFDGLVGVPAGSRAVILMPESTDAGGTTTPAIAAVIDVVGHVS